MQMVVSRIGRRRGLIGRCCRYGGKRRRAQAELVGPCDDFLTPLFLLCHGFCDGDDLADLVDSGPTPRRDDVNLVDNRLDPAECRWGFTFSKFSRSISNPNMLLVAPSEATPDDASAVAETDPSSDFPAYFPIVCSPRSRLGSVPPLRSARARPLLPAPSRSPNTRSACVDVPSTFVLLLLHLPPQPRSRIMN